MAHPEWYAAGREGLLLPELLGSKEAVRRVLGVYPGSVYFGPVFATNSKRKWHATYFVSMSDGFAIRHVPGEWDSASEAKQAMRERIAELRKK